MWLEFLVQRTGPIEVKDGEWIGPTRELGVRGPRSANSGLWEQRQKVHSSPRSCAERAARTVPTKTRGSKNGLRQTNQKREREQASQAFVAGGGSQVDVQILVRSGTAAGCKGPSRLCVEIARQI